MRSKSQAQKPGIKYLLLPPWLTFLGMPSHVPSLQALRARSCGDTLVQPSLCGHQPLQSRARSRRVHLCCPSCTQLMAPFCSGHLSCRSCCHQPSPGHRCCYQFTFYYCLLRRAHLPRRASTPSSWPSRLAAPPGRVQRNLRPSPLHTKALSPHFPGNSGWSTRPTPPTLLFLVTFRIFHLFAEPVSGVSRGPFLYPLEVLASQDRV